MNGIRAEETERGIGSEALDIRLAHDAPLRAEEICSVIEDELPGEPNLRMELTLVMPREDARELRVGLRVGEKKWYVVRDLPRFLDARRTGEPLTFQSRFVYDPAQHRFSEENEEILRLLDRTVAACRIGRWSPSQADARLMRLPDGIAEELLRLLPRIPFRVMKPDGEILPCRGIPERALPFQAECRMTPRGLRIMLSLPEHARRMTGSGAFAMDEKGVLAVPANQRTLLRYWEDRQIDGFVRMDFPLQAMDRAVGDVLPWLKSRCIARYNK